MAVNASPGRRVCSQVRWQTQGDPLAGELLRRRKRPAEGLHHLGARSPCHRAPFVGSRPIRMHGFDFPAHSRRETGQPSGAGRLTARRRGVASRHAGVPRIIPSALGRRGSCRALGNGKRRPRCDRRARQAGAVPYSGRDRRALASACAWAPPACRNSNDRLPAVTGDLLCPDGLAAAGYQARGECVRVCAVLHLRSAALGQQDAGAVRPGWMDPCAWVELPCPC